MNEQQLLVDCLRRLNRAGVAYLILDQFPQVY